MAAWTDLTPAGLGDLMAARSTDGGATWIGQNRVSTGTVASASMAPPVALAVTGTGTVHAAWLKKGASDNTLYYNRSTNGGLTWMPADTTIDYSFGPAAYSPDLAVSGANVYYAWQANLKIKLAKSANSGVSWSNSDVYTATGTLGYDLSLAAGPAGKLHLVWDEALPGGQSVCYMNSTTSGATWPSPLCTVVSLPSSSTPTDPDLAVDPSSGLLHLVYVDNSSGVAATLYMTSTNGVSWNTPITVSDPSFGATEPSVVISGSQKVYVTWSDTRAGGDLYYARSADGGLTWSTPSRVNDASAQPQLHSALVAGNNGPRAIWSDYRSASQWDIYCASITGACQFPLTGVAMDGPASPDPGITTTYTAVLTPTGADTPISYNWTPAPSTGQGTASAQLQLAGSGILPRNGHRLQLRRPCGGQPDHRRPLHRCH